MLERSDNMECENCLEKKTIRSDDDKKKLISRINRIKGQMDGIGKMINDDRYCGDILIQLAAISSSVKSLSSLIFERHMHSCVAKSIKEGDTSTIDEIVELFKKFS